MPFVFVDLECRDRVALIGALGARVLGMQTLVEKAFVRQAADEVDALLGGDLVEDLALLGLDQQAQRDEKHSQRGAGHEDLFVVRCEADRETDRGDQGGAGVGLG
jgi:hypothetical protein